MEKDSVDLVLEIKGITEHLELKLQAELKYLRDERDTVVRTLTKVSNELDLARKAGNVDLREAYDRLKREAEVAEQRHKDEMRAARAENAKLREAATKAFRRLTNQNILLEKVASLKEANLQLIRERDAARHEVHMRGCELDELAAHKEEAGQLRKENQRLQQELTAQEQENDRLTRGSPLCIDPDMSDPQPGKLLVVRLDEGDVRCLQIQTSQMLTKRNQIVGFLVETPSEPSEQGAWLIYDKEDNDFGGIDRWGSTYTQVTPFKTEGEAWEKVDQFTQSTQQAMRVVTLAEAEVLSWTMKEGAE